MNTDPIWMETAHWAWESAAYTPTAVGLILLFVGAALALFATVAMKVYGSILDRHTWNKSEKYQRRYSVFVHLTPLIPMCVGLVIVGLTPIVEYTTTTTGVVAEGTVESAVHMKADHDDEHPHLEVRLRGQSAPPLILRSQVDVYDPLNQPGNTITLYCVSGESAADLVCATNPDSNTLQTGGPLTPSKEVSQKAPNRKAVITHTEREPYRP